MRLKSVLTALLVAAWVAGIAWALFAADIGRIAPIAGTQLVGSGLFCESPACVDTHPVELPLFLPIQKGATASASLRFSIGLDAVPAKVQALYLPSFADDVGIEINGHSVRDVDTPKRLWNTPLIVSVPPSLLVAGTNRIDVILYGQSQEGFRIEPFYFGPEQLLSGAYGARYAGSITAAKFGLGLMVLLFLALGAVWLSRPQDRAYLWLSLSCASAVVFLAHYGLDMSVVPYRVWTITWLFSVATYVLLIMKFVKLLLGVRVESYENAFLAYLGLAILVAVTAPADIVFHVSIIANIGTELLALAVLFVFWNNRDKTHRIDMFVLFSCLSIAAALGLYDLLLFLFDWIPRNQHLFQYMPLVMSGASLWLIVARLVRSLGSYEALNRSLQEVVEQKTKELELSYKQLTEAEKARAVDGERKRIMLDLHDGIGGQLTNTLAYLDNRKVYDPVLRAALEEALRELAVMLDSLETEDSIATLLGMLRTRLEPLLDTHGLVFNWQVRAEPVLARPGPTQNLHLVRIVQEAITNVIKHAEATTITIAADETTVSIVDNGKGFELPPQGQRRNGHGLMSMKRRAEQIGALFEITSSSNGTSIRLVLERQ